VVHEPDVRGIVEALAFVEQACLQQQTLDVLVPFLGQVRLLRLLVDRVVTGNEQLRLRRLLGKQYRRDEGGDDPRGAQADEGGGEGAFHENSPLRNWVASGEVGDWKTRWAGVCSGRTGGAQGKYPTERRDTA
jgi:hypothetical protein